MRLLIFNISILFLLTLGLSSGIILATYTNIFSSETGFNNNSLNSEDNKKYFADVLTKILQMGSDSIPDINTEDGANAIVQDAKIIALYDYQDEIKAFNSPLKGMGINGCVFIPEKFVNQCICKYFGYNSDNDKLFTSIESGQISSGFYLQTLCDLGDVEIKIDKITRLDSGLLNVSGTNLDFKFNAIFRQSTCGGYQHWVPIKYSQND